MTSLVLVAIAAVLGIVPHWRAHRVRFAAGTIFGLAGIGGSLLGGFVIVPALVLALGFTMPEAIGTSLLVMARSGRVRARVSHARDDLVLADVDPGASFQQHVQRLMISQ